MNVFLVRSIFRLWPALASIAMLWAIGSAARADGPVDAIAVPGAVTVSDKAVDPAATPDAGMVLHISFALKSARIAGMDAFIQAQRDPKSPYYHKALTPKQVGERFGAPDADIKVVTDFAAAQGFKVTHVWPNKMFVSADATVAQAEQAFGFHIRGYVRPQELVAQGEPSTFYAPDSAARVPAAVAGRIESVTGFDSLGINHPVGLGLETPSPTRVPVPIEPKQKTGGGSTGGAVSNFSNPMSPTDVSTFYEFDPLHGQSFFGDGQAIGIFSPTTFNIGDVDKFSLDFNDFGWSLSHLNIDGGATDSNGQLEACLDTEVVIGQAHNTNIYMYEFPNLISNNIDAYNAMASDDIPTLSCSWGSSESFLHGNGYDSSVSAWDTVFRTMLVQGQALFCASGDSGAVVIEPSSDPNVTAVGGTDNLVDSSAAYSSEGGWSGSGGGNSIYWGEPGYQAGPGVSNGFSNGMRQVPDISADGGPTPGYLIHATGGSGSAYYHVWGTSASTPLWAVATLLIDQGTQSLGFGNRSFNLNPFLYDIGTNLNSYRSQLPGAFVFHDVTSGNSGFPCTDAWDYVTGWGSARFWKLYADDALSSGVGGDFPGGWVGPIGVSINNTVMTEPDEFDNLTTYYIGEAYACFGPADFRASTLDVQVDGADHFAGFGPLPAGKAWIDFPAVTTSFALGPHTINELVNGSLLSSRVVTARPYNDLFSHAQGISGASGDFFGINSYASKESGEPNHGGNSGGASVWYVWTAPSTGVFNFNTFGSNFDTTMGVYTGGSVSTLTTIGESDDSEGTFQSSVTIAATSGHQYEIAVDGYNGSTGNIELNWGAVSMTGFSITPSTVTGGSGTTGTVTLNAVGASPSGSVVALTNNDKTDATVPTTCTVAPGALTGTFAITTKTVISNKTVTVTGNYAGGSPSASFTIVAPAVSGVAVHPGSVVEGNTAAGTINLSGPAHSGTMVTLSSSNPSAVTVPTSVTVPAGSSIAHFTATTLTIGSDKTVTITATLHGTATTTLTVTVPTTMAVANATGAIGDTVPVHATLTRTMGGGAVGGQSVVFTVDGNAAGTGTTNTSGVATGHYTIPSVATVGTETIKATFAANSSYNGSTDTGTLTITKAGTTVTVVNVSGKAGKKVTLSATLKRATDNAKLAGQTLTFLVGGTTVGTSTTIGTGVATKSYTIPAGSAAGTKTIKVTYAGNARYIASTGTGTLTIH